MRKFRELLPTLLLAASLWLPAAADPPVGSWETISNPETNTGLVNVPRLLHIKGKIMLFWAGTSPVIKQPELYFASRGNGDGSWSPSKPPFFGQDLSRVRAIAVATARDQLGLMFERENGQGNGAMEILLARSADFGYSFNKPYVLDSFVLGDPSGSYVSIAARQGVKRPEFAACWVAESGVLRAALIDTRSGERPSAQAAGQVPDIKSHAEVVCAGGEGFYVVWPEPQTGLRSAHITPLQGTLEKPLGLAGGDYGKNFSVCDYYRGPGCVVATNENLDDLQSFITKDGKFSPLHPTQKDPVPGRAILSRTALDEDRNIHRVTLNPDGNKLQYQMLKDGKWSEPEVAGELRPDILASGIDIAVADEYVWIVVGQGQTLTVRRHKFK